LSGEDEHIAASRDRKGPNGPEEAREGPRGTEEDRTDGDLSSRSTACRGALPRCSFVRPTAAQPGLWGNVDLFHQLKGEGTFDTDLATTLEIAPEPDADGEVPELVIEEWLGDGKLVRAPKVPGQDRWQLADLPKSYFTEKGKLHRYILRVRVIDFKGIQKPVKLTLRATTSLTEGNPMPFLEAEAKITVAPERGTAPSGEPTANPSPTASASPSPTASATPSGLPSRSGGARERLQSGFRSGVLIKWS
jgi:hypothetical protein